MQVKEQDKEYNCGPYAVQFLLGLLGVSASIEELEKSMNLSVEEGISHDSIKKEFQSRRIPFTCSYNSNIPQLGYNLPAIINYQYLYEGELDGHYAVVLGKADDCFIIYNPATGGIEALGFAWLLSNWYSNLYGKGWYLHPTKSML
jgi:ABC-type bacteriocin/lantibiotic exporter with double-glycine peptidase domain